MRVGVVGTGFGARVAAPAFAAVDGCTVVDVVSARDDAAVAALSARRDLDLVSVHSPPFLHRAHVDTALAAGHAVLCDKPFGLGPDDAAAMLDHARAAGVVHAVNFEFRCQPTRRLLRELLGSGELGPVEHVAWTHVSAGSRVPLRPHGWLFERARGGGWIGAWAPHAVDALRWWLADELTVVTSAPRTRVTARPDAAGITRAVDVEDGFTAVLRAGAGATVAIDSTFAAPVSLAPRVVIVTESAVVEIVADAKVTVRAADGTRTEDAPGAGGGANRGADPHYGPMRRYAARVVDSVRRGAAATDLATFDDGLACARVLEALRAPAVSGG